MVQEYFKTDYGKLDGKVYEYDTANSFPFVIFDRGDVLLNTNFESSIHYELLTDYYYSTNELPSWEELESLNMDEFDWVFEKVEKDGGHNGRVWITKDLPYSAIFSLWDDEYYNPSLFREICDKLNVDYYDAIYVDYNENVYGIAQNERINVQGSNEKKFFQQIHLANQKDKEKFYNAFKKNRAEQQHQKNVENGWGNTTQAEINWWKNKGLDEMKHIIQREINKFLCEEIAEINDIYNTKDIDSFEDNNPLLHKKWANGFSIYEMTKLPNAYERVEYCSKYLQQIGDSGSRRVAFKLNDKYIIKLTLGKHRYQTKNEYDSSFLMSGRYDLLPRVIYQSSDFSWTIEELAKPLTQELCQQILGIDLYRSSMDRPSLEGFELWAEHKANGVSKQDEYMRKHKQRIVSQDKCEEFYKQLVRTNEWCKQLYKLEYTQRRRGYRGIDVNETGDYFRPENLGVVDRNGKLTIVIIDGGFIAPFNIKNSIQSNRI